MFSGFISFIAEKNQNKSKNSTMTSNGPTTTNSKADPCWVHDIFQGTLTNETRCLNCETVCTCLP